METIALIAICAVIVAGVLLVILFVPWERPFTRLLAVLKVIFQMPKEKNNEDKEPDK